MPQKEYIQGEFLLAPSYKLTVCDVCFLELALGHKCPLIDADKGLAKVAGMLLRESTR